eukprot:6466654-Amphidinium_carterae.1
MRRRAAHLPRLVLFGLVKSGCEGDTSQVNGPVVDSIPVQTLGDPHTDQVLLLQSMMYPLHLVRSKPASPQRTADNT